MPVLGNFFIPLHYTRDMTFYKITFLSFLFFCQDFVYPQQTDLESYHLKDAVKSVVTSSRNSESSSVISVDSLAFDRNGYKIFGTNYTEYGRKSKFKYLNIYDPDSNLCRKITYPVESERQFQPYYHSVLRTIVWLRDNGDTLKTDYCDSLGFFNMPFFPEFNYKKIFRYKKLKTLGYIFNSKTIANCVNNIDEKTICYYNENGLLTRLDYTGASYEEKVNYHFSYNENHLLSERKRIYDDTILSHHTLYQYHENGKIKEIKRFAYDTCCLIVHRFNIKGKITEELWFDTEQKYTFCPKDNSLFRHIIHEYDSCGRINKTTDMNSINGNLDYTYTYIYQYTDSNGSYFSYSLRPENDTANLVKDRYQYDEKGNLVLSIIHYDSYTATFQNEYEYDEMGNWIKNTYTIIQSEKNQPTTKQVKERVIEYY